MNTSAWNGATGNWRKAAHWSNGVPDAATQADFTAAGSYTVTLSRSDAFSVAGVTFDAAGATLALQGSLILGGLFDLQAGTLMMSKGGVIHGGTLMMDGGTLVSAGGIGAKPGTLDGVQLGGTLNLSASVEDLHITNGLTGVGAGARIELSGGENGLIFVGDQTIDNVMVVVENPNVYSVVAAKGTLTLGANATLTTTAFGPYAVLTGARVINDGSIISAPSGAGGSFNVGLDHLINNGLISAASNMNITSHELVNAAAGTIGVGPSSVLYTLSGFTNRGMIMIGSGGTLELTSNTSIVNAGTIAVGSGNLSIDQSTGPGVVTFTNTGAISVGAQGSLSLLFNFTVASLGNVTNAGRLFIDGTLDNSGNTLRLGAGPIFGGAGTTLDPGGLISGGIVVLGRSNVTYNGGGLENLTFEGVLDLSAAGAAVSLDGGVTVTSVNGTGPGVIDLTGAGSTLRFLDATGANADAIDNVTIDAGGKRGAVAIQLAAFNGPSLTLTLGAHVDVVSSTAGAQVMVQTQFPTAGVLINDGKIEATAAGGAFMVTLSTFENDGQVRVGNRDAFTLVGALKGRGQITLDTGGVAQLGAAAAAQSVMFADASGTLALSAAARFGATISGAVAGDKIDLLNTAATSASVNASDQLVITNNGAAVATLQLAGDYSHTVFNVGSDGAGGSLITLTKSPSLRGMAAAIAGLGETQAAAGSSAAIADTRPTPGLGLTLPAHI